MSKMRAAQIVEFGKPYQLTTVPIPDAKDDELLVEVAAAGFCHSDLQVLNGQFGTKLPIVFEISVTMSQARRSGPNVSANLPWIPSHEPAGTVSRVGPNCTGNFKVGDRVGPNCTGNFKVGDRVGVLNFKKACTRCTNCGLSKREYKYYEPRYCDVREMAGFQHDGAFAEYMTADPETTVLLPSSLPFEQAAPLMCAGATVWGALEKATEGLAPGNTIGIIGIGGLGHLGVQFAKAMGYRTVAIDSRAEGRQLATEVPSPGLRPDMVIDSSSTDATERVFEITGGEGLAAVVVCTDSLEVNAWALQLLRIRGTLMLLGLPPERWQFDSDIIVFRELVLKGSYVASKESTERMMQMVEKNKIRSHLTVIPWDGIPTIIDAYKDKSFRGRLVVQISK